MRRLHVWIMIGVLSAGGVRAEEDYHFFTDRQSRTISARITACDFAKNKVTMEREDNKQRVTVPIDMFSVDDQAYIKEWYMAHELISERNLQVTCKEKKLKKWTEESTKDVRNASGITIGERQDTQKFEKIAYEITFRNAGDLPLQKIRVEYRIYYEQSEKAQQPEPKQKVLKESTTIESLSKNKPVTVETQSVDIYKESITESSNIIRSDIMLGGKGEVHGLRARLYVALPSGKEVMREFSDPSNLSEKRFPW